MTSREFTSITKLFSIALLCALVVGQAKPEIDEESGLELAEYTEEIRGCYYYNETVSLCFDVRPDMMKLLKTRGDILVFFAEFGKGLTLFQILENRFIGFDSFLIALPTDAPTSLDELLVYWIHNYGADYTPTRGDEELLKVRYRDAIRELGKTGEVLLLELLSAALARREQETETLLPFHAMCRVLLKDLDSQLALGVSTAPALEEGDHDHEHSTSNKTQIKCLDLRGDPLGNKCAGLCGPGCSCWNWVCGDCCRHGGCYEHDKCCRRKVWSGYCLTPWVYNFNCDSYGGYPRCLQ